MHLFYFMLNSELASDGIPVTVIILVININSAREQSRDPFLIATRLITPCFGSSNTANKNVLWTGHAIKTRTQNHTLTATHSSASARLFVGSKQPFEANVL